MKKVLVGLAVSMLFITGCGEKNNKVKCSGKVEEDGQTYEMSVIGDLKDNKITSLSMEMIFDNEETATMMCSFMELGNSMAESEADKIDYKCDGKKLVINNADTMGIDGSEESLIGKTKEEFIKAVKDADEDSKITCK